MLEIPEFTATQLTQYPQSNNCGVCQLARQMLTAQEYDDRLSGTNRICLNTLHGGWIQVNR